LSETSDGLDRLAFQFKDSVNLRGTLSSFLAQFEDILAANIDLGVQRYLAHATGVQLDGLGEIVGLVRPVIQGDSFGSFGFDPDPEALGFGSLTDPNVGGHFFSDVDYEPMGDDFYRELITLKIAINTTNMNVDDTITVLSNLFDTTVKYELVGTFDVIYYLERDLTQHESILLNFMPELIGGGTITYIDNTPLSNWLLDGGVWNDAGVWADTAAWED